VEAPAKQEGLFGPPPIAGLPEIRREVVEILKLLS
jgi:hypothetical protein